MLIKSFYLIGCLGFLPSIFHFFPINGQCTDLKSCLKKNINQDPKELCLICNVAMPIARELIKKDQNTSIEIIKTAVKYGCSYLKVEQYQICNDAIELFSTPVLNIINDTSLNNTELCSVGLGCGPVDNPIFKWNITLPDVPKPPIIPPLVPTPDAPKLRILHISDIHIDFEYQPGALADCGQPLCCRNSSSPKNPQEKISQDKLAGYWGDYRNCDVPLWTVENMFDHLSKNEQFDLIYWTGDLPPHNVWKQSRQDQLNALDVLTGLFQKYFPKKIIYPSLGNHEASPVNLYPPPFVKEDNITWLYSRLAVDWVKTGLPEYLAPNITRGAFYTIQLFQGLRLVSLNMNYCPNENYYLYINSTDPLGQLTWLANVLQQSENIGEKVHIIGHIHPQVCLESFSKNYYRIINRYESTIAGQFFGHSHTDKFRMFYDLENLKRPIGITYISGSTTTYSYLNPSFRLFTVDGVYKNSSYQVLDHETHYLNITEANLSLKAVWKKEYSAKEAFNMTSLYPEDWNNLLNRMANNLNSPEVDKLYRYYVKSADNQSPCDLACRKSFICEFRQSRSDYFIPC